MAHRIRFGIVGTGGIAHTHAAALAALADDAERVACRDVAPERVARFAEHWGVRGQHGVVERPCTATLADCDRALEASAKHGTMISVMSQRRWFPSGDLPKFHAHQSRDVIGAIRGRRPPAVTGVDSRRVVAIIQGVYESGRTGRPVKLSD